MKRATVVALGLALAALPAAAQSKPTGARGDLIAQFDAAADKLIQLAEAIPQDKYAWRPEKGVRSVSEVLVHVTSANFFFPSFVGVQGTPPLPQDAEKTVTTKSQVGDYLKRSCEHMRGAIRSLSDADLDKPATMFGRQTTYRNVLLTAVSHNHEHLGQLIAYARMNGVAPPWSAGGS
jgi:uncharacterized damage-inducible protein DinB